MKRIKIQLPYPSQYFALSAYAHPGVTPYAYCAANPVKLVGPDGRDAIFISFPNYKIDPEISINVGAINWKCPKISGLGHAGVLLIDNKTGQTRYYEYGRYPTKDGTKGVVRNKKIPNVVIENGKPTLESLNKVLQSISKQSGQGGDIEGAYIESSEYEKMNEYAKSKYDESNSGKKYNKDRKPYTLSGNNCATFASDVINQDEEVEKPSVIIKKSPNNMVEEYQEEGHGRVHYDSKLNKTTIDE